MKRLLFAALLSLLILTSCQQDDTFKPAAELPFATHPSVLRGDWSGTIFNTPESKNSTLELTDIVAQSDCFPDEEQCRTYTFSGSISLDGSSPVPITGEGDAGDYIFALTTPAIPYAPTVRATFEIGNTTYRLFAQYALSGGEVSDQNPAFVGTIKLDDENSYSSDFRLEPTP